MKIETTAVVSAHRLRIIAFKVRVVPHFLPARTALRIHALDAGSDGSGCVIAIKAHCGQCLVQSPPDAEVPDMPANAIGPLLRELMQNAQHATPKVR